VFRNPGPVEFQNIPHNTQPKSMTLISNGLI
jgi:hypothetical protein